MREKLLALYKLQEIDSRALELEKSAKHIPEKITELEREAEALRTELGALHSESEGQRKEVAEAEGAIREDGAKVHKWKRRLNDIKTPREYQALSREVEQNERMVRELEDKVVALMEEIEDRDKIIQDKDARLKDCEGQVSEQVRDLRLRQAKLSAEANEIRRGRDEITGGLPKNIVTRYERVRTRRAGLAVALTDGVICSGCHVEVRPQQMVEVRKLNTVEQCPTCQRLLVLQALVDGEV